MTQEQTTEEPTPVEVSILSIDAWRYDEGWNWNQWYKVGTITIAELEKLQTPRQILAYMRREGYLRSDSGGKCEIVDDGYNVVVCERSNHMPLFAIAYGEVQQ